MEWTLLSGLTDEARVGLLELTTRRRLDAGEYLWHEGDPGETVHLIESGRLAVEVSSPDGFVLILAVRGPGEIMGELALVGPGRRTASVRAIEAVSTRCISATQFEELRRSVPEVDRTLLQLLAQRIEDLSARVLAASYEGLEGRVNRQLAVLSEAYRRPETPGPVVVDVTQDELARMVGSTRSSVNRQLRSLERDGAIELGRGKVVVHRSDALK